jgi:hypothetical protein
MQVAECAAKEAKARSTELAAEERVQSAILERDTAVAKESQARR